MTFLRAYRQHPVALELRRLSLLAAPLVLAQMAQSSLSFIDTLMVGRLGNEALAGIALGHTIFMLFFVSLSGVVQAVGPLVSQAHGANDKAAAALAARQGLWLAAALGLLAMLVFWNIAPVLLWMGQDPETVTLTAGYLRAISWGMLPALGAVALRSLLEGLSEPRPIMIIFFIGVGLNVLFNQLLMFGHWGLPALGLTGTGWASTLVFWGIFVMAGLYVHHKAADYPIFPLLHQLDGRVLRELLVVGVPIGLMLSFESGLFAVTGLLMGLLGQVELAAHQIAIQSASFTFMVPLGFAIATSVRVGQAVGKRDMEAARRAGWTGMGVCVGFMTLTALSFWLLPNLVTGLYLDIHDPANQEVVRLAASYLAIAAMFQLFDGLQVSSAGALRGLKDTRVPMVITLFSYWLVGLSSGALLTFYFGIGGEGLWFGLVLGLGTAAVLLPWRFYRSAGRMTPQHLLLSSQEV